jgi:uncharacterized protein
MAERNLEFVWDTHKARLNLKRHSGIGFQEAATVFDDPNAIIQYDPDHSEDEHREIIIGHSDRGRLLLVSFTERRTNLIRIISARKPTPQERTDYEQKITESKQDDETENEKPEE